MKLDGSDPVPLFHELELGRVQIEIAPQQEPKWRGDQRGPQCDVARIAEGTLIVTAQRKINRAPTSGRKVTVERIGQL